MKLSRFTKFIPITDSTYAVFNSLMMKVFYMSDIEVDLLRNGSLYEYEDELQNAGILVFSDEIDVKAFNTLKKEQSINDSKIDLMYLIVSSGCNLGCKYCYIENNQKNTHQEINMSEDVILSAIVKFSQYVELNHIQEPHIVFYGGEPTVNWDGIKYAVELAESKVPGIKFDIVTNGTLLTEDRIMYLSNHHIELGISIDGPKSLNDENRVYRNSAQSVYDKTVDTMKLLDKYSIEYGLSITVSDQILANQDLVLAWIKELNKKDIFFNLYHYTDYGDWEKYYTKACDFLIRAYEFLSPDNILDGRIMRKIESFANESFRYSDCAAVGGNQITIKPDGKVCICHGYLKTSQYELDHIDNLDFNQLKSSDEVNFWINRAPLNREECIDCEALFLCGGGCPLQAEALFNSRNAMDTPFCMHSKSSLLWLLKKGYFGF